jgi:hypothetical protein
MWLAWRWIVRVQSHACDLYMDGRFPKEMFGQQFSWSTTLCTVAGCYYAHPLISLNDSKYYLGRLV